MKLIVGSSALWPTPSLASKILSIMASTDGDVGIRANSMGQVTSATEEIVVRIGKIQGRSVVHFQAKPVGSSSGYERDVRAVRAADSVYAFFGPEGPVDGGTAHVVACALQQGIPVVAYGIEENGAIIEIGSDGGHWYRDSSDPFIEEIGWRR